MVYGYCTSDGYCTSRCQDCAAVMLECCFYIEDHQSAEAVHSIYVTAFDLGQQNAQPRMGVLRGVWVMCVRVQSPAQRVCLFGLQSPLRCHIF